MQIIYEYYLYLSFIYDTILAFKIKNIYIRPEKE
ncbi:hypothetical protein BSNT_06325 [Bacillus subtilis subsp. natto BEST195]|nr:hypothetical protein BSNT_06325 [Bacillus subtilis subsp. natto BEST195]